MFPVWWCCLEIGYFKFKASLGSLGRSDRAQESWEELGVMAGARGYLSGHHRLRTTLGLAVVAHALDPSI